MLYPYSDKVEVLNIDSAKGFRLAQTKLNEIVLLHIEQGGKIALHALPMNVTFYVISGNGIATIEDKTINAKTGDVVDVKANVQRGWENTNIEKLELLVIKEKV